MNKLKYFYFRSFSLLLIPLITYFNIFPNGQLFYLFKYFLIAFLLSFGLIPIFYKIGYYLGLTAEPGGRHPHDHETPVVGGIAIFISFITILSLASNIPQEFLGLFISSSILFLLGLLDDLIELSAIIKLAIQILASIILISYGIYISFLPQTLLGNTIAILMTLIWYLGITNAFNCIDGLDGFASTDALTITLFFSVIALLKNDYFIVIVSLILAGSILGFYIYNFRIGKPALVFLGDTGSTFIGFTLAGLAIYGEWGSIKIIDLLIPILLFSIPITDMLMTTIMRIINNKVSTFKGWLSFAGQDHLHHRLIQLGLSKERVNLFSFFLTSSMGLLSILVVRGGFLDSIIAILIAIIIHLLIINLLIFSKN